MSSRADERIKESVLFAFVVLNTLQRQKRISSNSLSPLGAQNKGLGADVTSLG